MDWLVGGALAWDDNAWDGMWNVVNKSVRKIITQIILIIIKIWNNIIIIIIRAIIILRHICKSMNINQRSTIIITIINKK